MDSGSRGFTSGDVHERLRRLERLIDAMPTLVAWVDRDERYGFINLAHERMFGKPRDVLQGMTIRDLIGEEIYERARDRIRRVLAGEVVHFEDIVPGDDGAPHNLLGTLIPDVGSDGEVAGFSAIVHDVTDRLRVEAETRRHQAELAHAAQQALVADMTETLAHELNQPLAAIVNYAGACIGELKSGAFDPAALVRDLELVSEQAVRAARIVARLRDFVRSEATEAAPCDLNDLIEEVSQVLGPAGRPIGVEVQLRLRKGLPPIFAHRERLQQALYSLGRAAIETVARDAGDGRTVLIETRGGAGEVEVGFGAAEVGAGAIAPPAEGLGLTVARRIIEAEGGRLVVGRGAHADLFLVYLSLPEDERRA
jgi:PAS domain S-box-containing protein